VLSLSLRQMRFAVVDQDYVPAFAWYVVVNVLGLSLVWLNRNRVEARGNSVLLISLLGGFVGGFFAMAELTSRPKFEKVFKLKYFAAILIHLAVVYACLYLWE